jgi:hypothetical protein
MWQTVFGNGAFCFLDYRSFSQTNVAVALVVSYGGL